MTPTRTIEPAGKPGTLDERLSFEQAAKYVAETTGMSVPCYRTLQRWMLEGVYGGRAQLRSVVVVRRRLTTRRWINEFFAACNSAQAVKAMEAEPLPSERERRRRYNSARKRLAELGGL